MPERQLWFIEHTMRSCSVRWRLSVCTLHPRDAVATEHRKLLKREASTMAQLSHPNVVSVYDVQDEDHGFTIAMEHVVGDTLGVWFQGGGERWQQLREVFVGAAPRCGCGARCRV